MFIKMPKNMQKFSFRTCRVLCDMETRRFGEKTLEKAENERR